MFVFVWHALVIDLLFVFFLHHFWWLRTAHRTKFSAVSIEHGICGEPSTRTYVRTNERICIQLVALVIQSKLWKIVELHIYRENSWGRWERTLRLIEEKTIWAWYLGCLCYRWWWTIVIIINWCLPKKMQPIAAHMPFFFSAGSASSVVFYSCAQRIFVRLCCLWINDYRGQKWFFRTAHRVCEWQRWRCAAH